MYSGFHYTSGEFPSSPQEWPCSTELSVRDEEMQERAAWCVLCGSWWKDTFMRHQIESYRSMRVITMLGPGIQKWGPLQMLVCYGWKVLARSDSVILLIIKQTLKPRFSKHSPGCCPGPPEPQDSSVESVPTYLKTDFQISLQLDLNCPEG